MNIGDGRFPKDDVYDGAAVTIAKAAEAGKQVTVLCESDPFLYRSLLVLFAAPAGAGTLPKAAEAGKQVTVLCEGDPFFYGSFMYLFARLADRCRVEVIPG